MATSIQSVTCPWCGTKYISRPGTNCHNCGGLLPLAAGEDRGPKPVLPPRDLPKKFISQVMLWKNVKAFIGMIFMIIGIPLIFAFGMGLIFAVTGYFLFRAGKKEGLEKIQALEHGIPVESEIVEVGKDTTQSMNGRNPFLVTYTFEMNGQQYLDKIVCWDESNYFRKPGDAIWVVAVPENPTISSPWPPMV